MLRRVQNQFIEEEKHETNWCNSHSVPVALTGAGAVLHAGSGGGVKDCCQLDGDYHRPGAARWGSLAGRRGVLPDTQDRIGARGRSGAGAQDRRTAASIIRLVRAGGWEK